MGAILEVGRLFSSSGYIISIKCQARRPEITTFACGRLTRVGLEVGALIFYNLILGPLQIIRPTHLGNNNIYNLQ